MALSDIVNVAITLNTAGLTGPNQGTPLILAYHTHYVDLQRSYTSLAAMVTDGFTTTEPAYKMAQVLTSQSPAPPLWIVGRRALAYTQTVTITVTSATAGTINSFSVNGNAVSYTVPGTGSPTVTTVAAALVALINATSGISGTATNAAGVITLAATQGTLNNFANFAGALTFVDATSDPGVATDLAAVTAANPSWYGLGLDSNSSAEILAAAAWIESNKRLFLANTTDTVAGTSTTSGNVIHTLKTSDYARTGCYYTNTQLNYTGFGSLCGQLTATPGSNTFAFKKIPGVVADSLSETQYLAILANNGNVYNVLTSNGASLGANITQFGTSASGEFLDITQFVDWLTSQIQIAVLSVLINNAKIPYTDLGVDMIKSVVQGVLNDGVNVGGLSSNPAPTVSAPLVANIDSNDIAIRNLPNVTFQGTLAGAIHTLTINGTISL